MEINKLAVIGAGNMGSALIQGLKNSGITGSSHIFVYDKDVSKTAAFDSTVKVASNIQQAVENAAIVFTVVKPQHLSSVLDDLVGKLKNNQSLVIVAAGKGFKDIPEAIGENNPVYLAMPNTAIAVNQSLTCVSVKNDNKASRENVFGIFDLLGKTIEIDEQLMGAATVMAACGTAYAMRYMRASALGGVEMGIEPGTATEIAAQIIKGAAELVLVNNTHPENEIDKVVTPKGITISGLNEMEHNGFSSAIIEGLMHAFNKVEEWRNK